jgi:hypothetical protein
MSSYAEQQLIYRVSNMQVNTFPFPHFCAADVFPADFYARMLEHFPEAEVMPKLKSVRPVGSGYSEQRLCIPLTPGDVGRLPAAQRAFWMEHAPWLLGEPFLRALMTRFSPWLQERFQAYDDVPFSNEILLVDDHTRYALGPHSDSPKKVLTLLFYLAEDLSQEHLGTSIYVPKQPGFACNGGPHYPFEDFERMYTVPFRPNTLFGFVKTANSFHGVEPIAEDERCRRKLMLYDINVPQQFGLGVAPGAEAVQAAQAPVAPKVSFTM